MRRIPVLRLRPSAPTARIAPRTVFLLGIGALTVVMAAWLASG